MNPNFSYFYLKAGQYEIVQPTNRVTICYNGKYVSIEAHAELYRDKLYLNGDYLESTHNLKFYNLSDIVTGKQIGRAHV